MARDEGALFRTAETVPAAKPTCSATSLSVTLPGWLTRDCFPFPIPRDYRRPLLISALKLAYRTKQSNRLSGRGTLVLTFTARDSPESTRITFQPALPNPEGTHRLYSAPSAIAATGPRPPCSSVAE